MENCNNLLGQGGRGGGQARQNRLRPVCWICWWRGEGGGTIEKDGGRGWPTGGGQLEGVQQQDMVNKDEEDDFTKVWMNEKEKEENVQHHPPPPPSFPSSASVLIIVTCELYNIKLYRSSFSNTIAFKRTDLPKWTLVFVDFTFPHLFLSKWKFVRLSCTQWVVRTSPVCADKDLNIPSSLQLPVLFIMVEVGLQLQSSRSKS